LMAVAEKAHGQGFGHDLVKASLWWFANQGATRVRVATQGRNIAAQRLYQACGFRTCAVHLWYHWWSPQHT
jgi:GNAT superfamily N-acetyltransferase